MSLCTCTTCFPLLVPKNITRGAWPGRPCRCIQQPKKISLLDLPNEILNIIFRFLFQPNEISSHNWVQFRFWDNHYPSWFTVFQHWYGKIYSQKLGKKYKIFSDENTHLAYYTLQCVHPIWWKILTPCIIKCVTCGALNADDIFLDTQCYKCNTAVDYYRDRQIQRDIIYSALDSMKAHDSVINIWYSLQYELQRSVRKPEHIFFSLEEVFL